MSLKDTNTVNPRAAKRVAMVIANPAVSTVTGWPVGFWWSELTHPYFAFTEAGYEVEIFSPEGGNRDRGKPRGSSPPTPPDMRVRIRRFGGLSNYRTVNLGI